MNIASLSLLLPSLFLSVLGQGKLDPTKDVRARIDQVVVTWRDEQGTPEVLAERLAALGRPAAEPLCDLLQERRKNLPLESIALALGRIGYREAADPIGALLLAEDVPTRLAAVKSLAALGGEKALTHLVKAVDDPILEIWPAAVAGLLAQDPSEHRVLVGVIDKRLPQAFEKGQLARILGRVGGEESRAVLHELLDTWDDRSKLAALEGLHILADPADGPRILEELQGSLTNTVRKQSCLFLGQVRHAAAARDLIDCLYDQDKGVVSSAAWALRKISGQELQPDPALWEQWYERVGQGS